MTLSRQLRQVTRTAWVLMLVATSAAAHEGHDHAAPEPVASDPHLIVRSASNDHYEVVLKYRSEQGQKSAVARVYLSDFGTNVPTTDARIALRTTTPRQLRAETRATSPGVYEATLPVEQAGKYTLILAVESFPSAEFAFPNLPLGSDPIVAVRSKPARGWPAAWAIAAGLIGLLATVILVVRRRSLRQMSRTALVLIGSTTLAATWWHRSSAHEGHQHAGEQPAVAAAAGPSQPRYMPKESQFFLGIRTVVGQLESLRARINAVGHVVAESGALASVESPRDGRIERGGRRLSVGDRVREGEVVANLLVIDQLPIRAPISGLVAEVRFTPGQWVQAGAPLVVILDERHVRVELPLFGENLNHALRTRAATITTSALPGVQFSGRVRGLAPTAPEPAADAGNERVAGSPLPPLLVSVENRGGLLRPGMLVEASLELPTADELIAVPETAVIEQESGTTVFVHTAAEVFEQRPVRIVGRYGARIGIAGSIRPGERIVVEGAQSLVSAPPVIAATADTSGARR